MSYQHWPRIKTCLQIAFVVALLIFMLFAGIQIIKTKSQIKLLQNTLNDEISARKLNDEKSTLELLNEVALSQTLANTVFNDRDPVSTAQKLAWIIADTAFAEPSDPGLVGRENVHSFYRKWIQSGRRPFMCGGSSCLMMHLLGATGLTGRYVGWLSKLRIDDEYNSHVTVEFYDGAKWLLIDPLLGFMYKSTETGEYVSALELFDLLSKGLPVTPVFLGQVRPPGPGKPDANNFLNIAKSSFWSSRASQRAFDLSELIEYMSKLKYVYVSGATVTWPEAKEFADERQPLDWDGLIDYDGKPLSIIDMGKSYEQICGKGFLR